MEGNARFTTNSSCSPHAVGSIISYQGNNQLNLILDISLIWICPESPRFLMRNGRFAEAYQSMRRLRETEIQACRDFYLAHSQLQMEAELARNPANSIDGGGARWFDAEIYQHEVVRIGFWKRIWRLVTIARNRRACYSSFIVMAAQILCGVRTPYFIVLHSGSNSAFFNRAN
jgi:hypothetical protein